MHPPRTTATQPCSTRTHAMLLPLSLGLVLVGLGGAQAQHQHAPGRPKASLYGTTPFVDDHVQTPQPIPGKVHMAYYDVGGPEVSYHSYDNKNHGSCDLNPCDGTYKNTFRKDDGISTSYTKPPNGGWQGDRFAGNGSQVPIDELYLGWNALGNWARVSLLVKEAGTYAASLFGTCNSGGTIAITVDDYLAPGNGSTVSAHVPATNHYHNWALFPDIASVDFPSPGLALLTVNITGIDDYKEGSQFGNLLYLDFQKQA